MPKLSMMAEFEAEERLRFAEASAGNAAQAVAAEIAAQLKEGNKQLKELSGEGRISQELLGESAKVLARRIQLLEGLPASEKRDEMLALSRRAAADVQGALDMFH